MLLISFIGLKFNKVFVVSVFSLLLSFTVASGAFALTGGSPATPEQSRGIVGLSFEGNIKNCAGVLLEPKKVLTTVGCLDFIGDQVTPDVIRVHPLLGSEIGGSIIPPTLGESVLPFVGVSSFIVHPRNTSAVGPYNLAILNLDTQLDIAVANIYGGSQSFIGARATSFGWEQFIRAGAFLDRRFYRANTLALPPLIDGDSEFESIDNGCYDGFEDTDTVFCAGYKNDSQYLDSVDEGSPLLLRVNGEMVVIGILSDASVNGNGSLVDEFGFRYEEFARISTMKSFILQNAPNTKFVVEADPLPSDDVIIVPVYDLLLSE